MAEHVDVIVVGAGLSGISAAYHLQTLCPDKTYAILEARDAIGGTWDLFRYPGIRSDSDMFTLGYRFKPYMSAKAIADGSTILDYVRETAREHGIDRKIRFGQRVRRLSWSSERARWTVEAQDCRRRRRSGSESASERPLSRYTCNFVYMCAGYFDYAAGYTPRFEGSGDFAGRIVHPQHWTSDVAYEGKRVIVIGSGATAMTLVPELAKKAAHVVMLQRSPTYVMSLPARDRFADRMRRRFSPPVAHAITRWKNILIGMLFFQFTQRQPAAAKRRFIEGVRAALGPDYDVEKHFTPRYNVWDQRVCLIPDADLFQALRAGSASVVTDQIDRFTRNGIRLRSGHELEADLIVTATGLEMQALGGAQLSVNGRRIELRQHLNYKGCMLSDVPNFAYAFGYTNASWTLKADLTAEFVCRVLRHMDATGTAECTPRKNDPTLREENWLTFTSGYIQRSLDRFPKQGSKHPFRLYQNYALDLLTLRYAPLEDGSLEFAFKRAEPERSAAARLSDADQPR